MVSAKNIHSPREGSEGNTITFSAPLYCDLPFYAQTPFTLSLLEITLFLNIHQKETESLHEIVVYHRSE